LLQTAPDVRDNDDDWGNKVVKVVVEIDQDRARQLGVTSEEVTRLLNTYFTGTAVSIYREGDNAIPIVLRAGAYTSQSLEGLTSATFAKNGGLVSLAQVARLKLGFDLARIRRKNQERTITVTARSASLTAGQLLESIQPGLQALDLAGPYHVTIGIPFGLLTAGQPLSFFGTLGIISLSGIIINNAIVLIDQIDIEREMLPLREAVVAASQKRLRPILLTSATTVLGLAPMAIAGGALWQPMAVLMMSGLAVASLLTLFFVPAGYFLLFRFDRSPALGGPVTATR
jgi:multidrug efflux pump subunit AcrB